ncbi:MAG: hypothetical protein D6784_14880, partial [Chloroflexi bacterium]
GPGQSITLNSNQFASAYSRWPGYFARGTSSLYLLVDSWNPGVSSGGVDELNEGNNLYTYPGGVTVTGLTSANEAGPPVRPNRPVILTPGQSLTE